MALGLTFSAQALELGPWSVSKAQLIRSCPLAWTFKYRLKIPEKSPGLVTRVGRAVHLLLEHTAHGEDLLGALDRVSGELVLTPRELAGVRKFLDSIRAFEDSLARFRRAAPIQRELCEERLGLDVELRPTPFFGRGVFFRGVWDLGFVLGDGRVAVIDHKTGRKRDLRSFAEQLKAYAVLAQAYFPSLTRVWPAVHFVGAAQVVWGRPVSRDEIRGSLTTWLVEWINESASLAALLEPLPVVSRFCDFCGYKDRCPAHTPGAALPLVQLRLPAPA